jgi:hypothetical protein
MIDYVCDVDEREQVEKLRRNLKIAAVRLVARGQPPPPPPLPTLVPRYRSKSHSTSNNTNNNNTNNNTNTKNNASNKRRRVAIDGDASSSFDAGYDEFWLDAQRAANVVRHASAQSPKGLLCYRMFWVSFVTHFLFRSSWWSS